MNNTSVESYLAEGCGRCDKFQTPECKVHTWQEELLALRGILQDTELEENMKWGQPTYSLDGKNVLMMSTLLDCATLNIFKGAAIDHDLLEKPGPNSRYARYLKFRSIEEVESQRDAIVSIVNTAIANERNGVEVEVSDELDLPAELTDRLAAEPELAEAFEALTPGRKRGYMIHIGGAKQSDTRARRVEKCIPKIMEGKGYNER